MKVVAFVPIKLNSERLPHKNILPIGGHPMCWHMLNTLLQVEGIDEVCVYCSDESVMQYLPHGVIYVPRDKRLDGSLVRGAEIYSSFIAEKDADIYVLAHATSPFVKKESIEQALKYILSGSNDSAFSAERIQTFAWYKGNPINYSLEDVPRTQDLEPVWKETSAFFMFEKELFVKYGRRIGFCPHIQEVSGVEALDIDEQKDYELAVLYSQGMKSSVVT